MVGECAMGEIAKQRKPVKIVFLSVIAICFAVVLYLFARGAVSFKKGYSWIEMDWNQDGSTTIAEFFESSDIDTRSITKNGRECVEYFSFKDGLTVKVVCP
jgi:hypothetical protein